MSYFNKCILPGCENQVFAAKLCKPHYDREMDLSKKRKVFSRDIIEPMAEQEIQLSSQILEEKHETTRDEGADR